MAGKKVTELMFSSKKTTHFHEERVGKMEKTGFDNEKEGAAERQVACPLGE